MTRTRFQHEIDALRAGLDKMGRLTVSQMERAIAAWEALDSVDAAAVIARDDEVDDLCAALDRQIFDIQILQQPVASDQRLLHVALIAVVALERVGDLAVAIAEVARRMTHEGEIPELRELLLRMSTESLRALQLAVSGIANNDVQAAEQAVALSRGAAAMLTEALELAAADDDATPARRAWATTAVLLARHLERVANNGAELGGRVRFLVTGEALTPRIGTGAHRAR